MSLASVWVRPIEDITEALSGTRFSRTAALADWRQLFSE